MSQVPIWFERKFEFSFPVELLPNLCARLRGTPAMLVMIEAVAVAGQPDAGDFPDPNTGDSDLVAAAHTARGAGVCGVAVFPSGVEVGPYGSEQRNHDDEDADDSVPPTTCRHRAIVARATPLSPKDPKDHYLHTTKFCCANDTSPMPGSWASPLEQVKVGVAGWGSSTSESRSP